MNLLINTDARQIPLADGSVNCIVTSPPYYGLRDYQVNDQIGLEQTPQEYVDNIVQVFRECRRILRDDGTAWLNLGDSYAGSGKGRKVNDIDDLKPKDLIGIPWMVAFALRDDGWYLRQDIIWHKPNPMPESVKDRCTKAHEYVFLLSKLPNYYYDYEAVLEPYSQNSRPSEVYTGKATKDYSSALAQNPSDTKRRILESMANGNGRNRRSVWTVITSPYRGAHYATFPPKLIEPMILAGCPAGGIVLDPFVGSGTTIMVANHLGRKGIGLDLNFKYLQENAKERLATVQPIMFT